MKYQLVCKEPTCGKTFESSTKRNKMYCSDECRFTFNNRARSDLSAYGDITTEMEEGPKRLTGRGSRAKGAKGERDVCHLISAITGEIVNRNIGQSRDGGHDIDWGPFALEVKSQQTVTMPAWQTQVRKSVEGTDLVPSVVWRRKAEEFWIALPMKDFVEIFNTLRLAAEAGIKRE